MNIKVVPFTSDHAYDIIERNIREGRVNTDIPENLNTIITWWLESGPAYTIFVDDEIVASAGVAIYGPHRGEAWSLMTNLIKKYPKTLFKTFKLKLDEIIATNSLSRVHSTVFSNIEAGCRFIEHLGFVNETPNGMKKFGPNGETVYLFART